MRSRAAGRRPTRRISPTAASSTRSTSRGGEAMPEGRLRRGRVLPGFGLAMGFTLTYLGLIVLIPLSTILLKTATLTWGQFWETVASPRTLAAYRLSFGASFAAALVNGVFGLLVAWVLERYD